MYSLVTEINVAVRDPDSMSVGIVGVGSDLDPLVLGVSWVEGRLTAAVSADIESG